ARQETASALLQPERREEQDLRWPPEALVLYQRPHRAGLRRCRKGLGTGQGSLSLRVLQDAVFAESGREQEERRRRGHDIHLRADYPPEGRKEIGLRVHDLKSCPKNVRARF